MDGSVSPVSVVGDCIDKKPIEERLDVSEYDRGSILDNKERPWGTTGMVEYTPHNVHVSQNGLDFSRWGEWADVPLEKFR